MSSLANRIKQFFSPALIGTVVTTALITYLGVRWGYEYNLKAFENTSSYQERVSKKEEALKYIEELSSRMTARSFRLQRFVWILKGSSEGDVDKAWDKYYESVEDWNISLLPNKVKIARIFGPEIADAFQNREESQLTVNGHKPHTIQGYFLVAHSDARKLKDCMNDDCAEKAKYLEQAQRSLDRLSLFIEDFTNLCLDTTNQISSQGQKLNWLDQIRSGILGVR